MLYNVVDRVLWFLCRQYLMDDDFFSEALDGKCEAVEYILRTVLRYRGRIKERRPDGHGFMEA